MTDPMAFHQYGRTFSKVEELVLRTKFRTEMTQGYWLYGDTGVGKSHAAFAGFNPSTHYVWSYSKFQNGYTGQETVIMNEFRGQIEYDRLLDLIDKWPLCVDIKCMSPVPFLAKKVIITSSLRPDEVYHRRNEKDSLEQLLRRVKVIEVVKGQEVILV